MFGSSSNSILIEGSDVCLPLSLVVSSSVDYEKLIDFEFELTKSLDADIIFNTFTLCSVDCEKLLHFEFTDDFSSQSCNINVTATPKLYLDHLSAAGEPNLIDSAVCFGNGTYLEVKCQQDRGQLYVMGLFSDKYIGHL